MLSPLTNLEVLALSGNKLGGRFTAEVAAFTKLNELSLVDMGLDGKSEPGLSASTDVENFNLVRAHRRASPRDYSHEGEGSRCTPRQQRGLHTPIEYWRAWRRHHKTRPLVLLADRSAQHPSYHLEFALNTSYVCAVSDAEKAALKAKLPNCRIYF